MQLYDFQGVAVNDLDTAYYHGSVAPLLVLPTGGGKTVIFCYIALRDFRAGRRCLILVHRRELVDQVSAALKAWGCPHGVISREAQLSKAAVQVGMVQTLANRVSMDRSGRFRFDRVIIDECHHAVRDSAWGAVIAHNAGAQLLGVSATPCRLDGKGLGINADGFFDSMVIGPSMIELIELGQLVRPVIYAPDRAIDVSRVKKRKGEFVLSSLASEVDWRKAIDAAIVDYREHCDRLSAIAFTPNVAIAEMVAEQFKAAGYQAGALDGATATKDRKRMIRDIGNGNLHVLASCNVVSEGTDIPAVFAGILLSPSESYAKVMQQIGRVLRSAPRLGKDRAIILDRADNVRRHGPPTEMVDWSLEGIERKARTSAATICIFCRAHIASRLAECPECGRSFEKKETQSEAIWMPPQGKLRPPHRTVPIGYSSNARAGQGKKAVRGAWGMPYKSWRTGLTLEE